MPFGITLAGGGGGGAAGWLSKVSNEAARLALSPSSGDMVVQVDDGTLWLYNGTNWELRSDTDPILQIESTDAITLTKEVVDPPYDDDVPTHNVKLKAELVLSPTGPDVGNTIVDLEVRADGLHAQMPYATNLADGSMSAQHVVDLETVIQGLADHLADTTDAHDASAISYDPTAPTNELVSTDAQAAITELDTRTNTQATPQFQDVQVIGTGLGNRLLGRTLALASSTGLVSGGVLSIGTPTSTFSIAAGAGEVVDITNPAAPVVTPVTWSAFNNQTVTNLATSPVTYVLIDSTGAIVQQTTYPTPVERRQMIFLGRLNHANNVAVTFANSFPDYKLSPIAAFYDLVDAMAPFKVAGIVPSANGANLSFNTSGGTAFFRSANYATNILNPNIITYPGGSPQAFRKMTQTQTPDLVDVTVVDPANYDVAGTVTPVGGGSVSSTVQRIYAFKSGQFRVQYGAAVYSNLAAAVAGIGTEAFIPNPTIENTAILVGYLALTRTATDLSDTSQARFIPAARFDAGGQASVGGTTTLQQAYLNSVLPQIILNTTQGKLQMRDGSPTITGNQFEWTNNGGTEVNFAIGGRYVQLPSVTTTNMNAIAAPAAGMLVYNSDERCPYFYNASSWEPLRGFTLPTTATVTDGATFTLSVRGKHQFIRVVGDVAGATPTSVDHTFIDEKSIVEFMGTSDTLPVTFQSSATFVLNGSCTLGLNDVLTMRKVGSALIESSRSE